jgi:peptide subunit release factor 1 (eRF1)
MITREQIHEIAQFEDSSACALSFYFQPATPRNKAHKDEAILTKDLAREAWHQLESKKNHKCASAREDLDRIVQIAQDLRSSGLRSNGSHAKAIFACSAQGFWREYDLPPQLSSTELRINRHFHLKPLAQILGAFPSLGIALVDRQRVRLFDLRLGELIEQEDFVHPLPRRRSDGLAGYDAGHVEHHLFDEARQHFKLVAEFLKSAVEKHIFENWILGCHDTHWPQFEPLLHPDVSQKLIGRFSAEVTRLTAAEIRSHAEEIFSEWQKQRCNGVVHEAIDQACANGRGVTGLRRVLRSLEMGEVKALLIGDNYVSQAVECTGCGHLDAHLVSFCPVCGRETREVVDVAEAILPRAINQNIELFYVKDNAELDSVGNIAALLRFRVEKNSVHPNNVRPINIRPIDEVGEKRILGRQSRLVGRYRGLAAG